MRAVKAKCGGCERGLLSRWGWHGGRDSRRKLAGITEGLDFISEQMRDEQFWLCCNAQRSSRYCVVTQNASFGAEQVRDCATDYRDHL
jgi:hypothetical protein